MIDLNLEIGQVVKSFCGRDAGRYFLIKEILDKNNVLLVDGDIRKLEKPKKKKIKHIKKLNKVFSIDFESAKDAHIRKILKSFLKDSLKEV